jgi:microcystin-dependent protein
MSDTYTAILTNQGLAKIAAAIADATTINLAVIALGDGGGNPVTLNAGQTSLVRQVSASAISSLVYNAETPTQCTVDALFEEDDGGYTIREFGVFDSDGIMIAVGSTPDLPKPTVASGAAIEHIQRVVFDVGNASAVTVEIDANILKATRAWVIDNYSISMLLPGGTTNQIPYKKSNADGDIGWTDQSGDVVYSVNVVEEKQTLSESQTVINLAICSTDGAAVYIGATATTLERLASDQWVATDSDTITLSAPATAGQIALIVQNEPAGQLEFLSTAGHLSEIADQGVAAQQDACANLGLPVNLTALEKTVAQFIMRVGYILTTSDPANPATYYGFGTWEPIVGRVCIGVDPDDPELATSGLTTGWKNITLSASQIPAHAHTQQGTFATEAGGLHSHTTQYQGSQDDDGDNGTDIINSSATSQRTGTRTLSSSTAPAHIHSLTLSGDTSLIGGGESHSNMMPCIAKHIWKRTA